MSKTKKNKKVKEKYIYLSRSKFCRNHTTTSDANNVACFCPYDEEYAFVYVPSHLGTTEYSCGCIRLFNKYYPEFNYHINIWNDFFDISLYPGQQNVPAQINISK